MIRQELYLPTPWMNAAGVLGYAPPAHWPVEGIDIRSFGAFITNPVSFNPRTPAAERGQVDYLGGALLHSGLPNPGFKKVLHSFARRWAQSRLPVWVHLIGSRADEIYKMVRRLESVEGVMAVEIGIAPDCHPENTLELIQAACGELPLIIQIPIDVLRSHWVNEITKLQASAISLSPPRGILINKNGVPLSGRLYGPSLLPHTLAALQSTRKLGIPIIAGGGIFRRQDAQNVLDQGAQAIQLDTVLWRGWVA